MGSSPILCFKTQAAALYLGSRRMGSGSMLCFKTELEAEYRVVPVRLITVRVTVRVTFR